MKYLIIQFRHYYSIVLRDQMIKLMDDLNVILRMSQ